MQLNLENKRLPMRWNGVALAGLCLALAGPGCGPRTPQASGDAEDREADAKTPSSVATTLAEEDIWTEPSPPMPGEEEAATNRVAWIRLEMRENARKMSQLGERISDQEKELRENDAELRKLFEQSLDLRRQYDERLRNEPLLGGLKKEMQQLNRRQARLATLRARLENLEKGSDQ